MITQKGIFMVAVFYPFKLGLDCIVVLKLFRLKIYKIVLFILRMASTCQTESAAFEEKVKRTVYLDNLSTHVTDSVLRSALNQFGTVKSVKFVPNYTELKMLCALVEMENVKQAKAVITALGEFPFMISGMPRPVRARPAEAEMLDDRPTKPGRSIQCRWLNCSNPDFAVAQKLKQLVRKHASEASLVLKAQLEEEDKIAKQQEEHLKANYKKFELIDDIMGNGTAQRLVRLYGMRVLDD